MQMCHVDTMGSAQPLSPGVASVFDLDRDLKLMALAVLFYAFALGLYLRLLSTFALNLGASGFHVGLMNATMLVVVMLSAAPGAWAAQRFQLKPVIVAVWWVGALIPLCFMLAPSWPWLFVGYAVSGMAFANNPAMKSYIFLKSEPARAARNVAVLYGVYPLGLTVAPLLGGLAADRLGMRTVFAASIVLYVLSATTASLIRDTPYHASDTPWTLATLWNTQRFRRYVIFFFIGYFAVYLGQDFVNPFLAQVHNQSFLALGVYSSLTAVGTTLLTFAMGRLTDTRGPRAGMTGVLAALVLGSIVLLIGSSTVAWGVAAFALGACDALRYLANGMVGASFRGVPLAWGYAVFDTAMGVPMILGAVFGGLLYRYSADAPFIVIGSVAAVLLLLLAVADKTGDAGEGGAIPTAGED